MNKKTLTILAIVLFMTIGYAALSSTLNIYGKSKLSENLEDFNVFLSSLKINDEEVEGINDTKDRLEILTPVNGVLNVEIVNDSTEYDTEAYVECEASTENSTNGLYDEIVSKSLGSSSSLNYNVSSVNSSTNGVYQLANNNLIYFYRGKVDNNVIFNNFCWKIIRTTDNKGVKLLYNGVPTDGKCSNSGTFSEIGKSVFNTKNDDNTYIGYMYGTPSSSNYDATHSNQNSSVIKDTLETWYKENMTNVTDKLEDAVYCNDRTMTTGTNNNVLGSSYGTLGYAKNLTGYGSLARSSFNTKTVSPSLTCTNDNDKFTVSTDNGNGKLTYPIGLITTDEMVYGGHNTYYSNTNYYKNTDTYLYSGEIYWTMTPVAFMQPYQDTSKAIVSVESDSYISSGVVSASYGVRPVITLNSSQGISKGEGTEDNPYIIGKAENTKTTITTDSQIIEAQNTKNVKIENLNTSSLTCKLVINKISRTDKKEKYNGPKEWTFDYTGDEQTFTVPVNGTYKLETWGSSGGDAIPYLSTLDTQLGGFGGYAAGFINLSGNTKLYINVGQKGFTIQGDYTHVSKSAYNGGGTAIGTDGYGNYSESSGSGGGATHIANMSGILSSLENFKDSILIVSGSGGGATYYNNSNDYITIANGGSGGGFKGANSNNLYRYATKIVDVSKLYSIGGAQSANPDISSSFGVGVNSLIHKYISGGGSGYYGGSSGQYGAGGGSGYIGNPLLTEKSMYCYNCEESTEEETKTISTTCVNEIPTENCAKKGNGYAKITLISIE